MFKNNSSAEKSKMRRRLLVDPSIQLPLLLYSSVTALIGILSAAIFSFIGAVSVQLELAPYTPFAVFMVGSVVSVGVMLLVGLVITNKVAGPLVRLREQMNQVAGGQSPEALVAREGDFTHSLFNEYNRMIERIPKSK